MMPVLSLSLRSADPNAVFFVFSLIVLDEKRINIGPNQLE